MFEPPKFKLKLEVASEGGSKHVVAITLSIAIVVIAIAYAILILLQH